MKKLLGSLLAASLITIAGASSAMNKAELIDAIASDAGLSKADAKRALESFTSATASVAKKGDKVSLVGFGSFSISKRAARTGRNPQTGATIQIKAKKTKPPRGSEKVTLLGSKTAVGYVWGDDNGDFNLELVIPEFLLDADGGVDVEFNLGKKSGNRGGGKGRDDIYNFRVALPTNPVNDTPTVDGRGRDGKPVYNVSIGLPGTGLIDEIREGDKVTYDTAGGDGTDGLSPLYGPYTAAFQPEFASNPCAGPLLAAELSIPADTFQSCTKGGKEEEHQAKEAMKRAHGVDQDCDSDVGDVERAVKTLQQTLANDMGTDPETALKTLDVLLTYGPTLVKSGDRVALVGFGSFSISNRAARTGRNPQTGATIQIKAKKVAKFKAGKALADTVK